MYNLLHPLVREGVCQSVRERSHAIPSRAYTCRSEKFPNLVEISNINNFAKHRAFYSEFEIPLYSLFDVPEILLNSTLISNRRSPHERQLTGKADKTRGF